MAMAVAVAVAVPMAVAVAVAVTMAVVVAMAVPVAMAVAVTVAGPVLLLQKKYHVAREDMLNFRLACEEIFKKLFALRAKLRFSCV